MGVGVVVSDVGRNKGQGVDRQWRRLEDKHVPDLPSLIPLGPFINLNDKTKIFVSLISFFHLF